MAHRVQRVAWEKDMKTFRLENGDEMPIVGLGTWKSQPGEVYAAVREAIALLARRRDRPPSGLRANDEVDSQCSTCSSASP
jgi:hypothetical protein